MFDTNNTIAANAYWKVNTMSRYWLTSDNSGKWRQTTQLICQVLD